MTRIHPLCVAFLLASLAQMPAAKPGAKEPPELIIDLSHIGQKGQKINFKEIKEVSLLPPAVVSAFNGIANPGGSFQSSDAINPARPLIFRRLIIAGISDKYCLVHYEHGGIALSHLIALFSLSKDKAQLVWVSNVFQRGRMNFAEMKSAVESGELRDLPGHSYW